MCVYTICKIYCIYTSALYICSILETIQILNFYPSNLTKMNFSILIMLMEIIILIYIHGFTSFSISFSIFKYVFIYLFMYLLTFCSHCKIFLFSLVFLRIFGVVISKVCFLGFFHRFYCQSHKLLPVDVYTDSWTLSNIHTYLLSRMGVISHHACSISHGFALALLAWVHYFPLPFMVGSLCFWRILGVAILNILSRYNLNYVPT